MSKICTYTNDFDRNPQGAARTILEKSKLFSLDKTANPGLSVPDSLGVANMKNTDNLKWYLKTEILTRALENTDLQGTVLEAANSDGMGYSAENYSTLVQVGIQGFNNIWSTNGQGKTFSEMLNYMSNELGKNSQFAGAFAEALRPVADIMDDFDARFDRLLAEANKVKVMSQANISYVEQVLNEIFKGSRTVQKDLRDVELYYKDFLYHMVTTQKEVDSKSGVKALVDVFDKDSDPNTLLRNYLEKSGFLESVAQMFGLEEGSYDISSPEGIRHFLNDIIKPLTQPTQTLVDGEIQSVPRYATYTDEDRKQTFKKLVALLYFDNITEDLGDKYNVNGLIEINPEFFQGYDFTSKYKFLGETAKTYNQLDSDEDADSAANYTGQLADIILGQVLYNGTPIGSQTVLVLISKLKSRLPNDWSVLRTYEKNGIPTAAKNQLKNYGRIVDDELYIETIFKLFENDEVQRDLLRNTGIGSSNLNDQETGTQFNEALSEDDIEQLKSIVKFYKDNILHFGRTDSFGRIDPSYRSELGSFKGVSSSMFYPPRSIQREVLYALRSIQRMKPVMLQVDKQEDGQTVRESSIADRSLMTETYSITTQIQQAAEAKAQLLARNSDEFKKQVGSYLSGDVDIYVGDSQQGDNDLIKLNGKEGDNELNLKVRIGSPDETAKDKGSADWTTDSSKYLEITLSVSGRSQDTYNGIIPIQSALNYITSVDPAKWESAAHDDTFKDNIIRLIKDFTGFSFSRAAFTGNIDSNTGTVTTDDVVAVTYYKNLPKEKDETYNSYAVLKPYIDLALQNYVLIHVKNNSKALDRIRNIRNSAKSGAIKSFMDQNGNFSYNTNWQVQRQLAVRHINASSFSNQSMYRTQAGKSVAGTKLQSIGNNLQESIVKRLSMMSYDHKLRFSKNIFLQGILGLNNSGKRVPFRTVLLNDVYIGDSTLHYTAAPSQVRIDYLQQGFLNHINGNQNYCPFVITTYADKATAYAYHVNLGDIDQKVIPSPYPKDTSYDLKGLARTAIGNDDKAKQAYNHIFYVYFDNISDYMAHEAEDFVKPYQAIMNSMGVDISSQTTEAKLKSIVAWVDKVKADLKGQKFSTWLQKRQNEYNSGKTPDDQIFFTLDHHYNKKGLVDPIIGRYLLAFDFLNRTRISGWGGQTSTNDRIDVLEKFRQSNLYKLFYGDIFDVATVTYKTMSSTPDENGVYNAEEKSYQTYEPAVLNLITDLVRHNLMTPIYGNEYDCSQKAFYNGEQLKLLHEIFQDPNLEIKGQKRLELFDDLANRTVAITAQLVAQQVKRTVDSTATIYPSMHSGDQGVIDRANVAFIEEQEDYFDTISGQNGSVDACDGSAYVSPFFVRTLNNNAMASRAGSQHLKLLGKAYDEYSDNSTLFKYAAFLLDNATLRMSGAQDDTQSSALTIFKRSHNLPLQTTTTDLIKSKLQGRTDYHLHTLDNGGAKMVDLSEGALNGRFNDGPYSLYDFWQYLGGAFSVDAQGNYTNDSLDVLMDIVDEIGVDASRGDVAAQAAIRDIRDNGFISFVAYPSAVKTGVNHMNFFGDAEFSGDDEHRKVKPFTSAKYNFLSIGLQGNFDHASEDATIHVMTQIISAMSQVRDNIGFTKEVYGTIKDALDVSLQKYGFQFSNEDLNEIIKSFQQYFRGIYSHSNVKSGEQLLRYINQSNVREEFKDLMIGISANDLFSNFMSTFITRRNNDSIRMEAQGQANTLHPSQGGISVYRVYNPETKDYDIMMLRDLHREYGVTDKASIRNLHGANGKIPDNPAVSPDNIELGQSYDIITAEGEETRKIRTLEDMAKLQSDLKGNPNSYARVSHYGSDLMPEVITLTIPDTDVNGNPTTRKVSIYQMSRIKVAIAVAAMLDSNPMDFIQSMNEAQDMILKGKYKIDSAEGIREYLMRLGLDSDMDGGEIDLLGSIIYQYLNRISSRGENGKLTWNSGLSTESLNVLKRGSVNASKAVITDILTSLQNAVDSHNSEYGIRLRVWQEGPNRDFVDLITDASKVVINEKNPEMVSSNLNRSRFKLGSDAPIYEIKRDLKYFEKDIYKFLENHVYQQLKKEGEPTRVKLIKQDTGFSQEYLLFTDKLPQGYTVVSQQYETRSATITGEKGNLIRVDYYVTRDGDKLGRTDMVDIVQSSDTGGAIFVVPKVDENGYVQQGAVPTVFVPAILDTAETDKYNFLITNAVPDEMFDRGNQGDVIIIQGVDKASFAQDQGQLLSGEYVNDSDLKRKYGALPGKIKGLSRSRWDGFMRSLRVLSGRIPGQTMQSCMAMDIVGFTGFESASAYVSSTHTYFQGSDYDIDTAYTLNYTLDRNGELIRWTPYLPLDRTLQNETLNMPILNPDIILTTSATEKPVADDEYGKWVEQFNVIARSFGDQERSKITPDAIISFINSAERPLQERVTVLRALSLLLQDIESYYNANPGQPIVLNSANAKAGAIAAIANRHFQMYRKSPYYRKSANVNKMVSGLTAISMRLSSKTASQTPVTTDTYKYLSESTDSFLTTMRSQDSSFQAHMGEANSVGKVDVSRNAVSQKAFFGVKYFLYTLPEDAQSIPLDASIHGPEDLIHGRPQTVISSFKLKEHLDLIRELKDVKIDDESNRFIETFAKMSPEDDISFFISASTDNAKDLQISMLNAVPEVASIYTWGLTLGFTMEELFRFMTSDFMALYTAELVNDKLTQLRSYSDSNPASNIGKILAKYNIGKRTNINDDKIREVFADAWKDLSEGEKELHINQFKEDMRFLYDISPSLNAFVNIGMGLSINQGMKTDIAELIRQLGNIQEAYKTQLKSIFKQLDDASKMVTAKDKDALDGRHILLNKLTGQTGKALTATGAMNFINREAQLDVYRFFNDEAYRQRKLNILNTLKSVYLQYIKDYSVMEPSVIVPVSLIDISGIPHFKSMFQISSKTLEQMRGLFRTDTIDGMTHRISAPVHPVTEDTSMITYYQGTNVSKTNRDFKMYDDQIRQADGFMDSLSLAMFLDGYGKYGLKGKVRFNVANGDSKPETIRVAHEFQDEKSLRKVDSTMDAHRYDFISGTQTLSSETAGQFKAYVEQILIPKLKNDYKGNIFFDDLYVTSGVYSRVFPGATQSQIGFTINMSKIDPETDTTFRAMSQAFSQVMDEKIDTIKFSETGTDQDSQPMRIIDILQLYNYIVNKGKTGSNSFTKLFESVKEHNVITEPDMTVRYIYFMGQMDKDNLYIHSLDRERAGQQQPAITDEQVIKGAFDSNSDSGLALMLTLWDMYKKLPSDPLGMKRPSTHADVLQLDHVDYSEHTIDDMYAVLSKRTHLETGEPLTLSEQLVELRNYLVQEIRRGSVFNDIYWTQQGQRGNVGLKKQRSALMARMGDDYVPFGFNNVFYDDIADYSPLGLFVRPVPYGNTYIMDVSSGVSNISANRLMQKELDADTAEGDKIPGFLQEYEDELKTIGYEIHRDNENVDGIPGEYYVVNPNVGRKKYISATLSNGKRVTGDYIIRAAILAPIIQNDLGSDYSVGQTLAHSSGRVDFGKKLGATAGSKFLPVTLSMIEVLSPIADFLTDVSHEKDEESEDITPHETAVPLFWNKRKDSGDEMVMLRNNNIVINAADFASMLADNVTRNNKGQIESSEAISDPQLVLDVRKLILIQNSINTLAQFYAVPEAQPGDTKAPENKLQGWINALNKAYGVIRSRVQDNSNTDKVDFDAFGKLAEYAITLKRSNLNGDIDTLQIIEMGELMKPRTGSNNLNSIDIALSQHLGRRGFLPIEKRPGAQRTDYRGPGIKNPATSSHIAGGNSILYYLKMFSKGGTATKDNWVSLDQMVSSQMDAAEQTDPEIKKNKLKWDEMLNKVLDTNIMGSIVVLTGESPKTIRDFIELFNDPKGLSYLLNPHRMDSNGLIPITMESC